MVENFVLYLTGKRVSQEEAIELHSQLVECHLTGKALDLDFSLSYADYNKSELLVA